MQYDRRLIEATDKNEDNDCFTLLAFCRSVMTEEIGDKIARQAQLSDENASLTAASAFGFAFLVRWLLLYLSDSCLICSRVEHKVPSSHVFEIRSRPMVYQVFLILTIIENVCQSVIHLNLLFVWPLNWGDVYKERLIENCFFWLFPVIFQTVLFWSIPLISLND